jgi:acyl carrier protein
MLTDPRLHSLMKATSDLIGTMINDNGATLGDLGLDSQSLAEFIVICEDIYGDTVDMNEVELDYDVSLREIHLQIMQQLQNGGEDHQIRFGR